MAFGVKDNQQLQQYVLTDVTPTGRVLGTGSYGSVEEVSYANELVNNYMSSLLSNGVVLIKCYL